MKRRLLWQLFPAFIIITVLGLSVISWNVSRILKTFYYQEKKVQLEQNAGLGLDFVSALIGAEDIAPLQAACLRLGETAKIRYTVIDLQGKVLGDSEESPEKMVNHFDRPEFQAALAGRTGSDLRPSQTLQQDMMYVAIPILRDGQVVSVLRTAVAMTELQTTLHSVYAEIARYGFVTAIILSIVSLGFSWKISRPLVRLRQGAERFARGDLTHRLEIPKSREIAELADSMNLMAAQLNERIRTIVQQKNQQQAVLSSMIEGVIAIGTEGKVMSVNTAAAEMLQSAVTEVSGRTVEEVVRNTELQTFIAQALQSTDPVEGQMVLHENSQSEQYLKAYGTTLLDDQGQTIGAVVVLNDVTRIRKLQQVRRDFVANVSHELKTPVTSIKGFIETLQDGAMNKPEDADRFLGIIARQTDRLNSIIDDLLALSRIEQKSQGSRFEMEISRIKPILTAAAGICHIKAREKKIEVQIDCVDDLQGRINASLIEQAVVNLIDNAVKYSDAGTSVRVEGVKDADSLRIAVTDAGCGIEAEHLPRLFERFYRVDKARSRTLGGTGLGLAIVKHIAQAHKGQVVVQSTPEQGSTFTIILPV
ncbi:MAG: sensor histidine kinase [Planctomycetota bacterium]|jgi:two-component system phosphate regulon sensor histidine kinase PhoR